MTKETQNENAQLERRYRRLLRAYPAWYRRIRGEEMLTTLLDAAQGRNRPTAGEYVDVMFGGLRKHLSVGSVPAAVVGVFAALLIATLGAIGGAVAGWQTAADLPGDAAADRLVQEAIPDMGASTWGTRHLFVGVDMMGAPDGNPFSFAGWDEYEAGSLVYEMDHPFDHYARLNAAKTQLATAGWRIGPAPDPWDEGFTAIRDGLTLEVSTSKYPHETSLTTVYIYRTTPTAVPVLTVVGLIIGGFAGWFATGRAYRRASRWSAAQRTVAAYLFGGGLILLFLPTGVCMFRIAESLIDPAARIPVWIGYIYNPLSFLTLLGTIALVGSLLFGSLLTKRLATTIAN